MTLSLLHCVCFMTFVKNQEPVDMWLIFGPAILLNLSVRLVLSQKHTIFINITQ